MSTMQRRIEVRFAVLATNIVPLPAQKWHLLQTWGSLTKKSTKHAKYATLRAATCVSRRSIVFSSVAPTTAFALAAPRFGEAEIIGTRPLVSEAANSY